MDSFTLSRIWFNFCFDNPEKVTPNHTALYFFAIEHCNRLGGKEKFGLPTEMAKDALGIKSWHTYINAFNDLVNWGFFKLIQKSKNQYSSNIIALIKNDKALDKALDKAIIKYKENHKDAYAKYDEALTDHISKQQRSTYQSNDSIIKQINNKTINIDSHEFYKDQLSKNVNEKEFNSYTEFVSFLHGQNDLQIELTNWTRLTTQVTYVQYRKLLKKAKEKNKKIAQMLYDGQNDIKYTKNKSSVYLTLNSWLNR